MINQQLVEYIKGQLQQGIVENEIRSSLEAKGWQEHDISEAFMAVQTPIKRKVLTLKNFKTSFAFAFGGTFFILILLSGGNPLSIWIYFFSPEFQIFILFPVFFILLSSTYLIIYFKNPWAKILIIIVYALGITSFWLLYFQDGKAVAFEGIDSTIEKFQFTPKSAIIFYTVGRDREVACEGGPSGTTTTLHSYDTYVFDKTKNKITHIIDTLPTSDTIYVKFSPDEKLLLYRSFGGRPIVCKGTPSVNVPGQYIYAFEDGFLEHSLHLLNLVTGEDKIINSEEKMVFPSRLGWQDDSRVVFTCSAGADDVSHKAYTGTVPEMYSEDSPLRGSYSNCVVDLTNLKISRTKDVITFYQPAPSDCKISYNPKIRVYESYMIKQIYKELPDGSKKLIYRGFSQPGGFVCSMDGEVYGIFQKQNSEKFYYNEVRKFY